MVEQAHRRPVRVDQRPGDAGFRQQLRELVALDQHCLDVALDERVAIEFRPPVDKGGDPGKDQIAAKGVIIQHRAFDVMCYDGGERCRRGDGGRPVRDAAAQHGGGNRQQQAAGQRDPAQARRLPQFGHAAVERRHRPAPELLAELQRQRRRQQQRCDKAQQLAIADVAKRHVQQQQHQQDARQRQPPAE